jgi:hypothetical protein
MKSALGEIVHSKVRKKVALAARRTSTIYAGRNPSDRRELAEDNSSSRLPQLEDNSHQSVCGAKYNLGQYVAEPLNTIVIKAHLHETLIVSERVSWIRLKVNGAVTVVIAYGIDNPQEDELILRRNWYENYEVYDMKDNASDEYLVVGRRKLLPGTLSI